MTIAALKFLLFQKMDNMVIIYSYRVKMKKFIPMKVLLSEKSNKILSEKKIFMMKSIILYNIVKNKLFTILLRSLNISKKI